MGRAILGVVVELLFLCGVAVLFRGDLAEVKIQIVSTPAKSRYHGEQMHHVMSVYATQAGLVVYHPAMPSHACVYSIHRRLSWADAIRSAIFQTSHRRIIRSLQAFPSLN